ncbi:MAG TPA: PhzF family phenazine biosynthesis protein [Solirubrobacteraceae bacterium]|nr:PhzF family phenazine biosynthesis protein [Solirubrobacteraceae bacterium]
MPDHRPATHGHDHDDAHRSVDGHPYEIWDVFTRTPLEGNPLGVFPRAEEIPSRLYQAAARELNLSETVFILPDDPAESDAHIRIFTPAAELPFAGHPTLGAAYAIATRTGAGRVRLRTGSGIITVRFTRDADGAIVRGEMEQPIPTVAPYPRTEALCAALGLAPEALSLPVEIYDNGPRHVVVVIDALATLSALAPEMTALAALGPQGIAVIAPGPEGRDDQVRSRNFCPGLGVPEDPATGSAAGPVAVHLLRHGRLGDGEPLQILQGVEIGRPSRLEAVAQGTPGRVAGVRVAGAAVRVAAGHYRLG